MKDKQFYEDLDRRLAEQGELSRDIILRIPENLIKGTKAYEKLEIDFDEYKAKEKVRLEELSRENGVLEDRLGEIDEKYLDLLRSAVGRIKERLIKGFRRSLDGVTISCQRAQEQQKYLKGALEIERQRADRIGVISFLEGICATTDYGEKRAELLVCKRVKPLWATPSFYKMFSVINPKNLHEVNITEVSCDIERKGEGVSENLLLELGKDKYEAKGVAREASLKEGKSVGYLIEFDRQLGGFSWGTVRNFFHVGQKVNPVDILKQYRS